MQLTLNEHLIAVKAKIDTLLSRAPNEKARIHLRKAGNFIKRAEEMQTGGMFDRAVQKALEHVEIAKRSW